MGTLERRILVLTAMYWGCATNAEPGATEPEERAEIIPFQSCADSTTCDPCPDGLCEVHFWPFEEPYNADRKVLAPTGSHVCVLSGVRGNLFDVGVAFGVHRRSDTFGERWYIGPNSSATATEPNPARDAPCPDGDPFCNEGPAPRCPSDGPCTSWQLSRVDQTLSSTQFSANGVGAYSTCVPLANFQTDQHGEIWTSEVFNVAAADGALASVNMWWGDAASFISTIGTSEFSHFDDRGDGLFVIQGGASTPTVLSARSYAEDIFDNDFMGGAAISLFVGVPHAGDLPRFYSFGGRQVIDAQVSADQRKSIDLDSIDSSLCYLTTIEGDFVGGGEWISVLPYESWDGTWRWKLDVRAGSGEGLYAAARCIKYDQCKHPENGCVHPVSPP